MKSVWPRDAQALGERVSEFLVSSNSPSLQPVSSPTPCDAVQDRALGGGEAAGMAAQRLFRGRVNSLSGQQLKLPQLQWRRGQGGSSTPLSAWSRPPPWSGAGVAGEPESVPPSQQQLPLLSPEHLYTTLQSGAVVAGNLPSASLVPAQLPGLDDRAGAASRRKKQAACSLAGPCCMRCYGCMRSGAHTRTECIAYKRRRAR